MQLSYTYLQQIISKMVQTDARFHMIRTQNPINDVVAFFQNLFIRLLEKWTHAYPNDFMMESDTITAAQAEHLATMVAEIVSGSGLHFPFVYAFFKDALRLCKKNLSSTFYEEMLLRSLSKERSLPDESSRSHLYPITYFPRSDKIAVIFDPRYDDLMEAVIRNFMHFLNPCGWNLMIFSAAVHKERIEADFPTCLFSPISDSMLTHDADGKPVPNISIDTYNRVFLSKAFWESIPATHIAIFQKDCVMYHMFDESIFLAYDFAGANYFHVFGGAPFSGGINGGFSLRNKNAMIECIENVSWDSIIEYNKKIRPCMRSRGNAVGEYEPPPRNEDCFFTNACEMLRKNLPDIYLREHLAIETGIMNPSASPSVYHGWNKNYHDIEHAKALLGKSPFFFNTGNQGFHE